MKHHDNITLQSAAANARRALRRALALLPLALMALALGLASCSEATDETEEYPDWRNTNTAYWNNLYTQAQQRIAAGDTTWKIYKSWSIPDTLRTDNTYSIIVHVLKEGTGSGSPLYTDSVRVHYKGRLLPSASYPNGREFDSSWNKATSTATAAPAQFAVAGLYDGFATALQRMHIGDEWEVYMAWPLGAGTKGNAAIPAYSVLTFDINLVAYFRAGTPVPNFHAKRGTDWVSE